jgi:hypothetical protein
MNFDSRTDNEFIAFRSKVYKEEMDKCSKKIAERIDEYVLSRLVENLKGY